MRNFKRFLALMLTVLMVAGCFALPTSAAASDKFDDVDQYVEAIDTLAAIGVVTGKSETTFGTDENVQRWQAALLYAKLLTGKVDNSVWQTGVNNSVFADLDENPQDLFVNAISYVNNNGIVTGKTATKFVPRDGITLEQGLTMAVRALGYETAAMKASASTGLWMYIDKAISLGLDAGLEDIVDYKATLTRGQMAQLLYNLLFVETADGYTYAAKSFNLITETFVLTSTNTTKYDIGDDGIKLSAPGYVGLTVLAEDGTLGKTYYFEAETLKSLLGADSADFSAVVGYSYDVIADDTLSTIYSIDQNNVKDFENTLDATTFTIAKDTGALTVDGKSYTVVDFYTKKLWNKGVKNTANTETLFYNWTEAQPATGTGEYHYYDENGNIVSKEGTILMYLVANGGVTTTYGKTYMVKDEVTGTFRLPTATDWANATYYMTTASGASYYKQYTSNGALAGFYNVNLFGEIKAIDDDNDGAYDRMFYTQYKFAQYTEYTNTGDSNKLWFKLTDANGVEIANVRKSDVTIKGTVANGNWIVYAWNATLPELLVKDVLEVQTGYVNGFSVPNSTITIDGTAMNINNLNLSGIVNVKNVLFNNVDVDYVNTRDDLIGRYVQYYKIGNTVVAFDNVSTNKYVVFDGIVSVNADNAISAKAYVESNTPELISIASLNGYPLSQFMMSNQFNTTLNYVYSTLLATKNGTIFTGAKDAKGQWHLYDYTVLDTTHDTETTKDVKVSTVIGANGIVTVDNVETVYVDANTSWVFVDTKTNAVIGTFKGVAAAGSSITGAAKVLLDANDKDYAEFVYVAGNAETMKLEGSFANTQYNTIVYIDKAQTNLDNVFSEIFTGTLWTYTKAVDLRTGTWTTVYSASARLDDGAFYYVKDNYAVAKANLTTEKIESIGTSYIAGILAGSLDSDSVDSGAIQAIIGLSSTGIITKDNGANIVSFYNKDNVVTLADADKYAMGYVVPITVNGVQKYTVVFTADDGDGKLDDEVKSHAADDDADLATWKAEVAAAYKFTVDTEKAVITLGYEDKATKEYDKDIQTVIVAPEKGYFINTNWTNGKTINGSSAIGEYNVASTTVNGEYKVTLKAKYTDGKYYEIESSDAITVGYDAKAELIKAVKADYEAKVENNVITVKWVADIDSMDSFILVGKNIGSFLVDTTPANGLTGDFEKSYTLLPEGATYTITAKSVMEDATVTLIVDNTIIDTWTISAAN